MKAAKCAEAGSTDPIHIEAALTIAIAEKASLLLAENQRECLISNATPHFKAELITSTHARLESLKPKQYTPSNMHHNAGKVIEKLQKMLKSAFGKRHLLKIETFGSKATGLDTVQSTLNFALIVPNQQETTESLHIVVLMNSPHIVSCLLQSIGMQQVHTHKFINTADTYSIRFRDPELSFPCELVIGERTKVLVNTSKLLKEYLKRHPVLSNLVLLVKCWAAAERKESNDNMDDCGTSGRVEEERSTSKVMVSNYAWSLMVIGFMQKVGVLPNLQLFEREKEGASIVVHQRIPMELEKDIGLYYKHQNITNHNVIEVLKDSRSKPWQQTPAFQQKQQAHEEATQQLPLKQLHENTAPQPTKTNPTMWDCSFTQAHKNLNVKLHNTITQNNLHQRIIKFKEDDFYTPNLIVFLRRNQGGESSSNGL
ncbi:hypothetical protein HDV05_004255 [Chytridiales sp. JEL 0842]|nr:hypothetical protein HDV05_004255 [Chytridiales sp. JEL 0842]